MRKINTVVTAGILILFLVHLFWGVLMMMGITPGGSAVFSACTYIMMILTGVHILIGLRLTFDTIRAIRKAGVSYPGQNRLFWIRRLSGFALVIFLCIHSWIFTGTTVDGAFRLRNYDAAAFAAQILMVLSLAVHLLTNIRPLKIALGIEDRKNIRTDILIVLSAVLLLSAIGFVIYLIRWQTL